LGEPSNEQISAKEQKSASFLISNLAATHLKMVNFLLVSAKLICSMKNICAIEAARFSVFFFSLFFVTRVQNIATKTPTTTRGVSHCGLAIYIKNVSEDKKKNYGNSNI
jgi:hypothetical protein